jgi:hypothetical protein
VTIAPEYGEDCEHDNLTTEPYEMDPDRPSTWTTITYCEDCGEVQLEQEW